MADAAQHNTGCSVPVPHLIMPDPALMQACMSPVATHSGNGQAVSTCVSYVESSIQAATLAVASMGPTGSIDRSTFETTMVGWRQTIDWAAIGARSFDDTTLRAIEGTPIVFGMRTGKGRRSTQPSTCSSCGKHGGKQALSSFAANMCGGHSYHNSSREAASSPPLLQRGDPSILFRVHRGGSAGSLADFASSDPFPLGLSSHHAASSRRFPITPHRAHIPP